MTEKSFYLSSSGVARKEGGGEGESSPRETRFSPYLGVGNTFLCWYGEGQQTQVPPRVVNALARPLNETINNPNISVSVR